MCSAIIDYIFAEFDFIFAEFDFIFSELEIIIGTIVADLEDRSHRETRTRVTVVLDDDLRILVLNHLGEFAEECWLADTCHILQTDFLCTGSDELVGDVHDVQKSFSSPLGRLFLQIIFYSPLA